jgi:hypothetical protein
MAKENDIVLIYVEDRPLAFARIEEISENHKKDWYHVRLLLLQIPLKTVTWILKDAYVRGEAFTMDGRPMRLELVDASKKELEKKKGASAGLSGSKTAKGKVIPLPRRRPKS